MSRSVKKYTRTHLLVDLVLIFLTGGLWLIVVVLQYFRRQSN